jgi:hypothetical protein
MSDRSIDNFFIVLPENYVPITTIEGKSSFQAMLAIISKKLVHGGKLRILTDLKEDNQLFTDLLSIAGEASFQATSNIGKRYFPSDWRDPEFLPNGKPQNVVFASK